MEQQTKYNKIMNIEIKQITNGWLVIVHLQSKGSSALYCKTFKEVMANLLELDSQITAEPTSPNRQ